MPEDDLIEEFAESLEDPDQRSWIRAYLEGGQEPEALIDAVLRTLEEGDETEEA